MKLGLGITQRKGKRRGTSTSPFLLGELRSVIGPRGRRPIPCRRHDGSRELNVVALSIFFNGRNYGFGAGGSMPFKLSSV